MEKSNCCFSSNSPPEVKTSICELLGMRAVENPGAYLGLPTVWGRSKKGALQYVKDRIGGKMHGWKNLLLSQAGKEVLIKAVTQAIPAYPMSGESEVERNIKWQAPLAPYLKMNVDAAWLSASGHTGIGIIIRNHAGEFKCGKICRTTSISAVDAEARAVIEGLSLAANHGYSHMCVESDSKPLIHCCLGKIAKGAWELYPSLGRIQELKLKF
ncbi:unnamed protein product, partial [Prunus brigantina]